MTSSLRGTSLIALGLVGAFVACGSDAEVTPIGPVPGVGGSGGNPVTTSAGQGGKMEPPRLPAQSCEPGTYAVSMDEEGMFTCAALDADVAAATASECDLHLGWRDSCNGCTAGPAKLGRVDGVDCENVAGADNACITPDLGGQTVPMFGLNTDGDVNGDDMFYLGWNCLPTPETPFIGPCEAGEHLVGADLNGYFECLPTAKLVAKYIRDSCIAFLGWRDGCNGCGDPPSKFGAQRGPLCISGPGADNVCAAPLVDQQWLPLIGVNTDGDVDDNDTFYVGLQCLDPEPETTEPIAARGRCPFGTLVTGVDEEGLLICESPSVDIAPTVQSDCQLAFGYRDSCSGCSDPPAKWGLTGTAGCTPGVATSCVVHDLGAGPANLLQVRADGDVDGNDQFYAGVTCSP